MINRGDPTRKEREVDKVKEDGIIWRAAADRSREWIKERERETEEGRKR